MLLENLLSTLLVQGRELQFRTLTTLETISKSKPSLKVFVKFLAVSLWLSAKRNPTISPCLHNQGPRFMEPSTCSLTVCKRN